MDRKQYEEDLARRQREHLDRVHGRHDTFWQPCMHDGCSMCCGTGVKLDGSPCVHMLSCPCPKCSPQCVVPAGVEVMMDVVDVMTDVVDVTRVEGSIHGTTCCSPG